MGPVELIVAAIVAGALAGTQEVTAQVIKDAYAGLKTLLLRKFGGQGEVKDALEMVEKKPDAPLRQAVLSEELAHAGAADSIELLQQAQTLWKLLEEHDQAVRPGHAASVTGLGAIAQGDGASAYLDARIQTVQTDGGASVGGNVDTGGGGFVGGNQNTLIVIAEGTADALLQHFRPHQSFLDRFLSKPLSDDDLRKATSEYLAHLLSRYQYLDFKGMGISDRVPLQLPLVEMYVPLKARVEMPKGETWARQLRVAGHPVSEEEAAAMGARLSEPQPVLELLKQHDGLIILGDPGAGKTTFLKYLALRLARGEGEALSLGTRLPVLVPLSAYANALEPHDVPLVDFMATYYRDRGVPLPIGPMLEALLKRGGVLLLLDGLDEVRDSALRGLVVDRVLDFFAFQRQRGNKAILTSRIVGYREVRRVVEGLQECTLVDFEEAEITDFVGKWTSALEHAARGDTAFAIQEATREREELLGAVAHNPGVRQLASNPLLLTILALMKRQGVTLPERRVELYEKYVETLLKHWNLARGLDRPTCRDLDVVETLKVLAPLALWMHQTSPGVGLVKREALRRKLEAIYCDREIPEPENATRQFLEDVRDHAGLLLERGAGEYGFIHLTFQEYLAAVAIAQQGQRSVDPIVAALAAHLDDDNWYEVSLLTIGYVGIVQQRDEAASEVLWELIQDAPGEPGQAAHFAGEAVVDAWPGGVTPTCREQVVHKLVETLRADTQVQLPMRAASGRVLSRLGDPRPEVMMVDGMQFCYVPGGPFWMGSEEDDTERPLHLNNSLDYDYWMARYPVTVAQFRTFAETSGIRLGDYDSLRGRDNEPVGRVGWHEALGFCTWLTQRWRDQGWLPEDWAVRLPSEAEWEKAARGGEKIPTAPAVSNVEFLMKPLMDCSFQENPEPQRRHPWGEKPDSNRGNSRDMSIRGTRAVGCFPGRRSPYDVEDLGCNVEELCCTHWEDNYEYYRGVNDLEGNVDRVLRGGGRGSIDERLARCAWRSWAYPYDRGVSGFRLVLSPHL